MSQTTALPDSTDVVVIGGGTMGLFAALFLAEAGREVVVVDRDVPWAEASGVNAGSLAVQNKLLPLIPYTLEALRMWREMRAIIGAEIGFETPGGLRIAMDEADCQRLRRSSALQREHGVDSQWLGRAELRREAPFLSASVLAATFSPQDSYASPLLLGPALLRAVAGRGARFCGGAEVLGIEGACVRTSRGDVRCHAVLIAAGAWSARVARLLGVHLPLSLDVNMVSVTEPAGPTIGRIITHVRGILTLKQVANGTCLIGGGWQGRGDLKSGHKQMDYESLLHNLRLATAAVPGLAPLNLIRQWAGFEGVTPDSLPCLGALPGYPRVFIAACARGGWTLGPVMGRLISEVMLTGQASMPVNCFAPGRFANG